MPPRFIPKSQGDESFPRVPHIRPTLGQFFPETLSMSRKEENEKPTCEEVPSSHVATCNTIVTKGDEEDPELEVAATPEELESLKVETSPSEDGIEEVNMNLRGGKALPEPRKTRLLAAEKAKVVQCNESPNQDLPQASSSSKQPRDEDVEYNVIAHLKRIPALLSIYDALMLMPELREALIKALQSPQLYETAMAKHWLLTGFSEVNDISFSEEDKMVESDNHNRPLYIEGNIGSAHLRRILIDPGSAMNLLPIRSLTWAGYTIDDLEPTNVVICGYDSNGSQVMGTITLKLQMSTFVFKVKFFVIEFVTSYSALLGRPWLHKYQVIPSTLHQCFKFIDGKGEQQQIVGNLSPYTM